MMIGQTELDLQEEDLDYCNSTVSYNSTGMIATTNADNTKSEHNTIHAFSYFPLLPYLSLSLNLSFFLSLPPFFVIFFKSFFPLLFFFPSHTHNHSFLLYLFVCLSFSLSYSLKFAISLP